MRYMCPFVTFLLRTIIFKLFYIFFVEAKKKLKNDYAQGMCYKTLWYPLFSLFKKFRKLLWVVSHNFFINFLKKYVILIMFKSVKMNI
jgi:hypothetical protein